MNWLSLNLNLFPDVLDGRIGSIVSITDSAGDVVESYKYSSFGEVTIFDNENNEVDGSTIDNPYTYTAREFDSETDLYYYRARYFDASLGIFISKDPIGFIDGPNRYSYVNNNPRNYIDPYGLSMKGIIDFFKGLVKSDKRLDIIEKIKKRQRELQKRLDDPRCSFRERNLINEHMLELDILHDNMRRRNIHVLRELVETSIGLPGTVGGGSPSTTASEWLTQEIVEDARDLLQQIEVGGDDEEN